jgi:hypothetical protein
MKNVFSPNRGATVNIDVSTSNQRVAVYSRRRQIAVRVYNDGSATAWIDFGDVNVVASATTGMPINSKESIIIQVDIDETMKAPLYMAAIAAGATGKIYFTPGEAL